MILWWKVLYRIRIRLCLRAHGASTIREFHSIVKARTGDFSLGTMFNLKPFYIEKPTEREKESCLCIFCLNLRLRFNTLQNQLKDNGKKLASVYVLCKWNKL